MRLCTTILACEPRSAFAEALAKQCAALKPRIFWSRGPLGLAAASTNFRATIRYVAKERPDWWLMLEDDQVVFPEFFRALPDLIDVADARQASMVYLADRQIAFSRQAKIGCFTVNILTQPVPGSHGLLVRGELAETIAAMASHRAIFHSDGMIWDAIRRVRGHSMQIMSPVLMRHLESKSTLGHEPRPPFIQASRSSNPKSLIPHSHSQAKHPKQ